MQIHVPKFVLALPVLVALTGLIVYITSSRSANYLTEKVQRSDITQEALASGNVASPKNIDLQFETSGKVALLRAETGQKVQKGDLLGKLDTAVLEAEKDQALSELAAQKAALVSLQEGTRPEELAVTQSQISLDETALSQAEQSVIDSIQNAYTVSDSAVKNSLDQIFENPSTNPNLRFLTANSQVETSLEGERSSAGLTLATWRQNTISLTLQSNLSGAENLAQSNLQAVAKLLADANSALSSGLPGSGGSTADIQAWGADVALARASVSAAVSGLTEAVTLRKRAALQLERDQKSFDLQKAGARESEIDAQAARVSAAQASVAKLNAQIAQMSIIAPLTGTVTAVNTELGETVLPQTPVVSMIPESELQIDVDLSEENVAYAKVGDPVRITLDAFENAPPWPGTVVKIDPAQTEIGGAVYYKTTVNFDQADDRIKPGMTANTWIQVGVASSTLVVPASALQTDGDRRYVQVLFGGEVREVDVSTGLKSKNGYVEVFGDLREGDDVVVGSR